jgi:hypothetical protein
MRLACFTVLLLGAAACGARVAGDGGESAGSDTSSSASTDSSSSASAGSTSTSSTSTDDDDDADVTDGADAFLPDEDVESVHPFCTVFDQDCPEGEKCVTTLDPNFDVYRCVPILGDQAVGEACTFDRGSGADDCDATSHCWNLETDDQGVEHGECVPICIGTRDDPSCPGQGESCEGFECKIFGQIGYPFCVERCDPIAQDCDEGKACFLDPGYNTFFCGVVNVPGALGEPCGWIQECAAGLTCLSNDQLPECLGDACCSPICLTGDDAGCEGSWPGTVCSDALDYPLMEGCPTHGACMVPSP